MRRWFIFIIVTITSLIFFPAVAGCAQGYDAAKHPRPVRTRYYVDTGSSLYDAGFVPVPRLEQCNGFDDDYDGYTDEEFTCLMGGPTLLCTTFCGATGYRLCEPFVCVWSPYCYTFVEACTDIIDNDCDGLINEGC